MKHSDISQTELHLRYLVGRFAQYLCMIPLVEIGVVTVDDQPL